MFIDKARIYVEAGSGGDGMSSFRREKFVEKGGPNGGNGGRGGNVILRADNSLNTLIDFRYKRKFIAKRGDKGGTSNMTGHRGEDVIVKVPLGTVVRDDETNIMIADLTEDEAFWKGCEGCVNVDVLHRTGRKYCICTAMLYDPTEHLPAKIPDEALSRIRHLQELEEQ